MQDLANNSVPLSDDDPSPATSFGLSSNVWMSATAPKAAVPEGGTGPQPTPASEGAYAPGPGGSSGSAGPNPSTPMASPMSRPQALGPGVPAGMVVPMPGLLVPRPPGMPPLMPPRESVRKDHTFPTSTLPTGGDDDPSCQPSPPRTMKKPRVIPTVVLGNVTSDSYDERTRKFDGFKNNSLDDVDDIIYPTIYCIPHVMKSDYV